MRIRALLAAAITLAASVSITAMTTTTSQAYSSTKEPVVIVGGLIGMGPITNTSYLPLAAKIKGAGFDPHIWTAWNFGLGDINANAKRLNAYVDQVRARTGSSKVKIVTHSLGGLVAREYIKNEGGAAEVSQLTMMAPTNNGTALANLGNFVGAGVIGLKGISQQAIGSPFLTALNSGDQSVGNVKYTSIATVYDEIVLPYTSSFMRASDGNIENVTLQHQCPWRFPEHFTIAMNGAVIDGVIDTLKGQPVRMNCWAI